MPELERRYRTISASPESMNAVDLHDLSTWPRFLAHGADAARSMEANGGLLRLRETGSGSALAALALEAWPGG